MITDRGLLEKLLLQMQSALSAVMLERGCLLAKQCIDLGQMETTHSDKTQLALEATIKQITSMLGINILITLA